MHTRHARKREKKKGQERTCEGGWVVWTVPLGGSTSPDREGSPFCPALLSRASFQRALYHEARPAFAQR